jgi:hypothetical protein|tara:strand:- start:17591 stop:17884 length:294 start_codon:yes stop_codon:yes gene_type:complete
MKQWKFIKEFNVSNSDSIKQSCVSYLWHKAITDQEKARLSLDLLMNNAVGIGDHSTGDFYKNLEEALDILVDAGDRLSLLQNVYGDYFKSNSFTEEE